MKTAVVVAVTFVLLAASSRATAADVTVTSTGSVSLRAAISAARPGDRILLRAGTYPSPGWIGPVSGTAAQPITVLSVDGPRRAILEGGGETLRLGDASSYLVFDGLELRGSGNNLIHIDGGSHHIVLRNLFAHDAGTDGDVLKINQAHHITVERSEFARPGRRSVDQGNPWQECLDFVDVDDAVIRDNFFHDAGSMLLFVKGGARNTVIERNLFTDQRAGASDPMVGLGGPTDLALLRGEQYEAFSVTFRNNVVSGGLMGGVGIYDCNGCYLANNLFLNNDRVVIEFRAGNGPAAQSTNVRVVNNLMVDTRGRMPEPYRRASHGLTDFATSHNQFWNAGAAIPATQLLALATQPGHLVADPLVTAPAVGADQASVLAAVRPRAGSTAGSSGMDASGAPFGVVVDVLGAPRGARWDRGPFIIVSTPPPTIVTTITTTAVMGVACSCACVPR